MPKFEKGNAGGPGRPRKALAEEQRRLILEEFPEESQRKAIAKVVKQAEAGSLNSITWLMERIFGKVADQLDAAVESGGTVKLDLSGVSVEQLRVIADMARSREPQSGS